jgi:hypothetical protein
MKQDMRRFSSLEYEQSVPWLYYSCIKSGYLCKYCELFQKEVFQSVHTDQALLQTFPNVIFNVICAVCKCNRSWTRWFRFTTFNKSCNTLSIVAVSLTFDFRGFPISAHRSGFITDFSKCMQTSLLDEYHPCLYCLCGKELFNDCCETCLCQKRMTTECTKNRDEKRTDDRVCNRII